MKPNIIILLPTLSIAGGTQRCAIDQAIMLDSDYDVCLCTLDDKKSVLEIPQTIRVFSLKSNSNIIFSRFLIIFGALKTFICCLEILIPRLLLAICGPPILSLSSLQTILY